MRSVLEIGGRRLPFLRWSVLRMMFGIRKLTKEWQVGDGREEALANHVEANAKRGDPEDVIRVIDDFCMNRSVMINVGDEKGEILDAAVHKAAPQLILELGTYCGYSALRMSRAMPPGARIVSLEFLPANAEHRPPDLEPRGARGRGDDGASGRSVTAGRRSSGSRPSTASGLDPSISCSSTTTRPLTSPTSSASSERGWLHPGSIVVADNVRFPGAPEYRAYMQEQEGKAWRTIEHDTHVEYQSLMKDLVLESEYVG